MSNKDGLTVNLWSDGDCYCGTFRLTMPHGMAQVSQGEQGILFIHTKLWCPDESLGDYLLDAGRFI